MYKQSPIFVKTFDFLKWIISTTEKFPKSQRFFLAKRLNDAVFNFYETIVEVAIKKGRKQKENLQKADAYLFNVRHYVRLSNEMGYISFKQYKFASTSIEEIGRLIGGWMKKIK